MDLTAWLIWFLNTLELSLTSAIEQINTSLAKSLFWLKYNAQSFLPDQVKIINRLFDDVTLFKEGINASKYQKITKVSKATATRHLADLRLKGCIQKQSGDGRSTHYKINIES